MLTIEDKLTVLSEDFDTDYVLENADITKYHVFKMLYEEGLLNLDDFIDISNETEEIESWEE
jgi:hypothetical protein